MLRRMEVTLEIPNPATSIVVELTEAVSGDPIPGADIFVDGDQVRSANSRGRCSFQGRFSGRHMFWVSETECHLDFHELDGDVDSVSGDVTVRVSVHRTLATVVMVRNHIRLHGRRVSEGDEVCPGIQRDVILQKPDADINADLHGIDTGHWWAVVHRHPYSSDPPESYGWYPGQPITQPFQILRGVNGILNGQHANGPEPFKDPCHGREARLQDEFFMPLARTGDAPAAIRRDIHVFASTFTGDWAYRFGLRAMNCHEFQRELMRKVGLSEPSRNRPVHRIG